MFCGCDAAVFGAEPNTHVCPVCLGMPGVLPVINRTAVEYTIMTGLALNCQIAEFSQFARKNYNYPDLMKGYQISQYDLPLTHDGWIDITVNGQEKRIGIRRVHLEEDTAKLFHVGGYSLIDINRSGVPLMEIVSEPDMHSVEDVRQYITCMRTILRYLGVNSGDMEKGAMRFEANVSIRPVGSTDYGTRVEIKNLNSFRAVLRSVEYEIERQSKLVEAGGVVEQETMGWDEIRGVTVLQRSKEYAHDYRYFPEPDLPPLVVSREWIEKIHAGLPELPDAKAKRFIAQYGLSAYDAGVLVADKPVADFFEACVRAGEGAPGADPKAIANWVTGELFRLMKEADVEIEQVKLQPASLVELLALITKGVVSSTMAKAVFEEMFATGRPPGDVVAARGLAQISDVDALRHIVRQVIAANHQAVADYRAGKETALRFLVGQVMKATKGQANPTLASQLLIEELKSGQG
jgi:aspartyl-tRNA(Asn)/glutamyl-tRNA(Gln) amidotransferase subunit B